MSKIKEWFKKNYLFAALIAFILVLLIILVIVRVVNQGKNIYNPEFEAPTLIIKHHEANEYQIIQVDDQDMALAYYKDWVYLLVNNPKEAYEKLDKKSKEEYDSYEKFEKWIKQRVTVKTKTSTLKGYKFKKTGGRNEILVSTTDNMRYRFIEYSVWNYKVVIVGPERNEPKTTKIVLAKDDKTTKKKTN